MSEEKNKSQAKDGIEKNDDEMGFLDHLEDLRKRVIWALISVIIGCIIAGFFINPLMELILLNPAKAVHLDLQNLRPFGQPFLYFKVIFVVGLIISIPFILLQLWLFVAPGLYPNERKWIGSITIFTSFCFLVGVAFAYFVMIPAMLTFAASFGSETIKNIIDINEYFSFITIMLLASGLLFEMPMVAYILARVGIITPRFLSKYRRHAIVINLILAAILTPTTDPVSLMIFAIPLFALYELSIIITRFAKKKKADDAG